MMPNHSSIPGEQTFSLAAVDHAFTPTSTRTALAQPAMLPNLNSASKKIAVRHVPTTTPGKEWVLRHSGFILTGTLHSLVHTQRQLVTNIISDSGQQPILDIIKMTALIVQQAQALSRRPGTTSAWPAPLGGVVKRPAAKLTVPSSPIVWHAPLPHAVAVVTTAPLTSSPAAPQAFSHPTPVTSQPTCSVLTAPGSKQQVACSPALAPAAPSEPSHKANAQDGSFTFTPGSPVSLTGGDACPPTPGLRAARIDVPQLHTHQAVVSARNYSGTYTTPQLGDAAAQSVPVSPASYFRRSSRLQPGAAAASAPATQQHRATATPPAIATRASTRRSTTPPPSCLPGAPTQRACTAGAAPGSTDPCEMIRAQLMESLSCLVLEVAGTPLAPTLADVYLQVMTLPYNKVVQLVTDITFLLENDGWRPDQDKVASAQLLKNLLQLAKC